MREALERAGLTPPELFIDRYPHELSGGQRQRVAIAASLVLDPKLLVADEPVSMLDVSVRAGILSLLDGLRKDGMGILMITHDLSTAAHFADRIAVMYLGRIVEEGPAREVVRNPQHPYTRALITVVPKRDPREQTTPQILTGETPNPVHVPPGCRFHPRCPIAEDELLGDRSEPPAAAGGAQRPTTAPRASSPRPGRPPTRSGRAGDGAPRRTRLIESFRSDERSPIDVADETLERIEAIDAGLNAFVTADRRPRAGAGAAAGRAYAAGAGRPAGGRPGGDQGSRRRRGRADQHGVARPSGSGRGRRLAARRPHPGRGRGHRRQDDDVGVRLEGRVGEPRERAGAQPVAARPDGRRIVGRAPQPRSPPESCAWRRAATAPARSGSRRRSAACSA